MTSSACAAIRAHPLSLIRDTFFFTQALLSSYTCAHLNTSTFATTSLPSLASSPSSSTQFPFLPSLYFSSFSYLFLYTRLSWLRLSDNQSQPRRAFPAIILLLPGLSPLTLSISSTNIRIALSSRQSAWGGARPPSSFSPSPNNARLPHGPPPATTTQAASFPPLGPSTPTPRQDHKAVLQNLASHTVRIVFHFTITIASYSCSLPKRGRPLLL